MPAGAQIGFHAAYAYNASTGQETAVGNALVGAYLSRIRLPYKAVIYITRAAPTSMTWLTFSEAKQNGIDVTLVDKSTILSRGPSGSGTSTPLDEAEPPVIDTRSGIPEIACPSGQVTELSFVPRLVGYEAVVTRGRMRPTTTGERRCKIRYGISPLLA
jgi:hypothetical protein